MNIGVTVNGSRAVIAIEGKLTVQTSPDLEAAVGRVDQAICDIDLDLANVDYVSSAGLRVIVAASKLAATRGGVLRLLHPKESVMEVFEMTGLSQVLVIEA